MRDRKQIREAIEGVTAETGGWDAPPTWGQIADVLAALLAPAKLTTGEVETARASDDSPARRAVVAVFDALCNRFPVAPNGNRPGEDHVIVKAGGRVVRVRAEVVNEAVAAPLPAEVTPRDDLRERAIAALAEAGGVPESIVRAAAAEDGIVKREVAAVERALREERAMADALRRSLDDLDIRLTRARNALTVAGVPDLAEVPGKVCGRALSVVERIEMLAARKDDRASLPPSPPEVPGVLAVVELETRLSEDRTYRVARAVVLPADAPERVTVAVLTGNVAGIVEAHKALTDYLRHCQSAKCGCEWLPLTYSVGPDSECETGKALAEKVRAAEVKPAQ